MPKPTSFGGAVKIAALPNLTAIPLSPIPGDIPLALIGVPGVLGLPNPFVDIPRLLLPFAPDPEPLVFVEMSEGLLAGVLNELDDVDREREEMVRRRGLEEVEAFRLSLGPVLRLLLR